MFVTFFLRDKLKIWKAGSYGRDYAVISANTRTWSKMGFFEDENTVDIKNDLDVHDVSLYVLFFILVLLLVIYYLRKKCNKLSDLAERNHALEQRIAGGRV